MEDDLETMRQAVVQLRERLDQSMSREVELTIKLSSLRTELVIEQSKSKRRAEALKRIKQITVTEGSHV